MVCLQEQQTGEVEEKRFSNRVVGGWNIIARVVKNVKTVSGSKRSYKYHIEQEAPI
jgi:hypothetical protein